MTYYYLDDERNKQPLTKETLKRLVQTWGLAGSTSYFTGGIPVVEPGFMHNIFIGGLKYSIDEILQDAGYEVAAFWYGEQLKQLDVSKALALVDQHGVNCFNHIFIQDKDGYVSIEGKLQEIIGRKKRYWRRNDQ